MDPAQIVGPIILFLLMSLVGLDLTLEDFRRVGKKPSAVVAGTASQLICLPLMTWGIVWAFGLEPAFGAGAVLVAVSPGAGLSNIMASMARANAALSVTLTAVASLLTVVTLPTFASFGTRVFLGESSDVEIPVGSLIGQLVFMLLVPITLGMVTRARRPDLANRMTPWIQRVTLAFMVLAVAALTYFAEEEQRTVGTAPIAFAAAAAWTVSAMAIGWTTARAIGLDAADRFTFLIEFGARNIAVSGIVALSGLGRLDLTYFSGAYMVVGYPMVACLALWRRRRVGTETAETVS